MLLKSALALAVSNALMAEAGTEGSTGGSTNGTPAKKKTEVTMIKMEDGREVGFAGKRKVNKETLIDEALVQVSEDGSTLTVMPGAVKVRMDFRSGKTRTFALPLKLLPKFAGHGGEQKYGDELAAPSDKPLSDDDMVMAVEELDTRVQQGEWSMAREGGFAGASVVVLAIAEASRKDPNDPASGKSIEEVKAFLQKKLDDAKAKNEKLSRKELYDSFRNPNSKVGKIVERLEKERLAKESKVDADAALDEINA